MLDGGIESNCPTGNYIPAAATFLWQTDRDFYATSYAPAPTLPTYWMGEPPDPLQASALFSSSKYYTTWGQWMDKHGQWIVDANPGRIQTYMDVTNWQPPAATNAPRCVLSGTPFHAPLLPCVKYAASTAEPFGFGLVSTSGTLAEGSTIGDLSLPTWRNGCVYTRSTYEFINTYASSSDDVGVPTIPGWKPSVGSAPPVFAFTGQSATLPLTGQAAMITVGNNLGVPVPGSDNFNYAAPCMAMVYGAVDPDTMAEVRVMRLMVILNQDADGSYDVGAAQRGQYVSPFKAVSGTWSIIMRVPTRDTITDSMSSSSFAQRKANLMRADTWGSASPFVGTTCWSDFDIYGAMPGLVTSIWTFAYAQLTPHVIYQSAIYNGSAAPQMFEISANEYVYVPTTVPLPYKGPPILNLTVMTAGPTITLSLSAEGYHDSLQYSFPAGIGAAWVQPTPTGTPDWWQGGALPVIRRVNLTDSPTAGTMWVYSLGDIRGGTWTINNVPDILQDLPFNTKCPSSLFDVAMRCGVPDVDLQLPYAPSAPSSQTAGQVTFDGGPFDPTMDIVTKPEAEWVANAGDAAGAAFDPAWLVNSGQPDVVAPITQCPWLDTYVTNSLVSDLDPPPLFRGDPTDPRVQLLTFSDGAANNSGGWLASYPFSAKLKNPLCADDVNTVATCRLAQWAKTFPNPEIDIEMPSNAPQNAFVATRITDANLLNFLHLQYESKWLTFRARDMGASNRSATGDVLIPQETYDSNGTYNITVTSWGSTTAAVNLYITPTAAPVPLTAQLQPPFISAPAYTTSVQVTLEDATTLIFTKAAPFTITPANATGPWTWTLEVSQRPPGWTAATTSTTAWPTTTVTVSLIALPQTPLTSITWPADFVNYMANAPASMVAATWSSITFDPPLSSSSAVRELDVVTSAQYVNKYDTANVNCYRWTNGNGTGTYCNAWVQAPQPLIGADDKFHTYVIDVDAPSSKVTFTIDNVTVINDAFVPGATMRLWIENLSKNAWGNGGWCGAMEHPEDFAVEIPGETNGNLLYATLDILEVSFTPRPDALINDSSLEFAIPDAFDQQRTMGGPRYTAIPFAYTQYAGVSVDDEYVYRPLPSQEQCVCQSAVLPLFETIRTDPWTLPTMPVASTIVWASFVINDGEPTRYDLVLSAVEGSTAYVSTPTATVPNTFTVPANAPGADIFQFQAAFADVPASPGATDVTTLAGVSVAGSVALDDGTGSVVIGLLTQTVDGQNTYVMQSWGTVYKDPCFWYAVQPPAGVRLVATTPPLYEFQDENGDTVSEATLWTYVVAVCTVPPPWTITVEENTPAGSGFTWTAVLNSATTPWPSTYPGVTDLTLLPTPYFVDTGSAIGTPFALVETVTGTGTQILRYACLNVLGEFAQPVDHTGIPATGNVDAAALVPGAVANNTVYQWWPALRVPDTLTVLGYNAGATAVYTPAAPCAGVAFVVQQPFEVMAVGRFFTSSTAAPADVWVIDVFLNKVVIAPTSVSPSGTSGTTAYTSIDPVFVYDDQDPSDNPAVYFVLQPGRVYLLCTNATTGDVLQMAAPATTWPETMRIVGAASSTVPDCYSIDTTTYTGANTAFVVTDTSVPVLTSAFLSGVFLLRSTNTQPAVITGVQADTFGFIPAWNADPFLPS